MASKKAGRGKGFVQDRAKSPALGGLGTYRSKRNFAITSEPAGKKPIAAAGGLEFVIQKHDASHLHYDFRLEFEGVLKSWAVPKGPSLDPARKSLAIQVEDHPIEYGGFEGIIPEGQYGGGTVLLWDRGIWEPVGDAEEGFKKGRLHFVLHGQKLEGEWNLVRMHGRPGDKKPQWLLMKVKDQYASDSRDILGEASESVKSGRSLEQIADNSKEVWESNGSGKGVSGEKKKSVTWPAAISPQLATLVDHPPEGKEWLHEIKFDGYRLLAYIQEGQVRLMTRNEQDWTHKFPGVAKAMSRLKIKSAILDGEVVVLDEKGHSDFQALQSAFKEGGRASPIFYAFDLLFQDGVDLREAALVDRKKKLSEILNQSKPDTHLRFSDHVQGDGRAVIKKVCGMALEGIISKRADAMYVSRRDTSWLKSKCTHQQEMVIVGYTKPDGSRKGFGSLLLGYHDDEGRLVYAGRVGTGFDDKMLMNMGEQLGELERESTPLDLPVPARERREAHWVKPTLVAEVRFSSWTRDGRLRHPAFIALRSDKPAAEIKREIPLSATQIDKRAKPSHGSTKTQKTKSIAAPKKGKPIAGKRDTKAASPLSADVRLTHPDKILYPAEKITKQDVAEYYGNVKQWMLPHVVNRPLTLLRCPGGAGTKCFFQRNWTETLSPELRAGNKRSHHLVISTFEGLLSLVQINAMEIHTWNCHEDDIDHPDQLIFDLDPGPGVVWKDIVKGATLLKAALEPLKLPVFLKTSGGKGLHLTVPIEPNIGWDAGKSFCEQVAKAIVKESDIFVANMRKDLRQGKIYIDYQRNGQSATAVTPYSTRARTGAAVSMPISWAELPQIGSADHFTIVKAAAYVAKRKEDPWSDFDASRVDLRRIAGQGS